MSGSRANTEPNATIDGDACYLLSRWFRIPAVVAQLRAHPWMHGRNVGEALHSIHETGRAWESGDLVRRDTAVRCELSPPSCATITTEQAAQQLGLGTRQVQDLARSGRIAGRRVGRRWQLDPRSVRAYQQHRQQKRTA